MPHTIIEAEVDLSKAAEMVNFSEDALRALIEEGTLDCGPGNRSPLKFRDVCQAMASLNFRRAAGASRGDEAPSPADTAAHMCMLPMLAFASHIAKARYGFQGPPLVMTSHPSHVPERYVALHGTDVIRFGTLEALERGRGSDWGRFPTMFIFDTKAAAEHLVDELRASPFRLVSVGRHELRSTPARMERCFRVAKR